MNWPFAALLVVLSYIVGSIPTGYLVVKQLKGLDIRDYGSGNTGATNVKRVAGNKAFTFVLLIDCLKGLVPVLIAQALFPTQYLLHIAAAIAAVVGHSKSVFLKFGGGKSAITGLGGIAALAPVPSILMGIAAFLIIKLTRLVSLATLTMCAVAPFLLFVFGVPLPYTLYCLACSLYVTYLHRANITRLMQGTENRI